MLNSSKIWQNVKNRQSFYKKNSDKENHTRSPFCPVAKNVFTKSKSFSAADIENFVIHPENLKRKKVDTRSTATQTEANKLSPEKKSITVKDLTSDESPGEHYWEILAGKRREALEETLEENKYLHERIESLESELESKIQM